MQRDGKEQFSSGGDAAIVKESHAELQWKFVGHRHVPLTPALSPSDVDREKAANRVPAGIVWCAAMDFWIVA